MPSTALPRRKRRRVSRDVVSVLVSAGLVVGATATAASAAGHWHSLIQPRHSDVTGVRLGTPFPFTVDFKYTTAYIDGVHTDVVEYREWFTGARDVHYLRHAN